MRDFAAFVESFEIPPYNQGVGAVEPFRTNDSIDRNNTSRDASNIRNIISRGFWFTFVLSALRDS